MLPRIATLNHVLRLHVPAQNVTKIHRGKQLTYVASLRIHHSPPGADGVNSNMKDSAILVAVLLNHSSCTSACVRPLALKL